MMLSVTDKDEFEWESRELVVHPGVFNPTLATSSKFLAERIPLVNGLTVLDMACGCGILGITAFLRGAKHVDFVDISSYALENTHENLTRLNIKDACAFYSNVFSHVSGKYDVILLNSPFVYTDEIVNGEILHSIYDTKYMFHKKFFSEVGKHLNKDGYILMVFSGLGNKKKLLEIFDLYCLKYSVFEKVVIENDVWEVLKVYCGLPFLHD